MRGTCRRANGLLSITYNRYDRSLGHPNDDLSEGIETNLILIANYNVMPLDDWLFVFGALVFGFPVIMSPLGKNGQNLRIA